MHFNLVGFFFLGLFSFSGNPSSSWIWTLQILWVWDYVFSRDWVGFFNCFLLNVFSPTIEILHYQLLIWVNNAFFIFGYSFSWVFFPGNTSSSWRWTWPNFMVCDYAFFRDWVGFIKRFLDYVFSFIIINLWVTNAFFFWIFHILEFHLQEHQH